MEFRSHPRGRSGQALLCRAFAENRKVNQNFSGVALMPSMTDKPGGTYRVALYSDDKMLTQESFQVSQDLSAKKTVPAETPAEAKPEEHETDEVARKFAMQEDARAKIEKKKSELYMFAAKSMADEVATLTAMKLGGLKPDEESLQRRIASLKKCARPR